MKQKVMSYCYAINDVPTGLKKRNTPSIHGVDDHCQWVGIKRSYIKYIGKRSHYRNIVKRSTWPQGYKTQRSVQLYDIYSKLTDRPT